LIEGNSIVASSLSRSNFQSWGAACAGVMPLAFVNSVSFGLRKSLSLLDRRISHEEQFVDRNAGPPGADHRLAQRILRLLAASSQADQ
jgi:hypothetical protein